MSNNKKKYLTTGAYSTGFQSPEVSPYSEQAGGRPGIGAPKAWCSERVPLSGYKARRHVAASALMPFSSGRTLPSKWDDAERWISSPSSVGNVTSNNYNNFHHHHGGGGLARTSHFVHHNSYYSQRRAKSKSGPLGPTGLLSYGSFNGYSPVLGMGVIHGGQWRNSVTIDSPGVVGPARFEDVLVGNCDKGSRKSCPGDSDWLDLWSGPLIPNHDQDLQDEIHNREDVETHNQSCNEEVGVDRIISRRDMSTQMFVAGEMSSSPSSSIVSSPKSKISTTYSPHPQLDDDEVCENANQYPESQVKDVQVDEHIISTTPKSNLDKDYNYHHSPSNSIASNTDTKISEHEGEEDRIKAWEKLQKAKAEAAIQKLEMELEKKRSSSMEKITEKLKKAEKKAEKMRSSVVCKGDDGQIQRHTTRSFSKLPSFCRKFRLGCYPF